MESDMDPQTWSGLMDRVVGQTPEHADYKPGNVMAPGAGTAPGSGTEGDSPLGLQYVNMGPLALVLNEALDATVNRGADRDSLLASIAQQGGEEVSVADVVAVLAGDTRCPDPALLAGFADAVSVDLGTIIDAATRGGCTDAYPGQPTPGTPPGY